MHSNIFANTEKHPVTLQDKLKNLSRRACDGLMFKRICGFLD